MGAFPHYGGRWAEWNGNFRDTVRSFIKGSEGPWAKAFASAVCGSPSIYAQEEPGKGVSTIASFIQSCFPVLGCQRDPQDCVAALAGLDCCTRPIGNCEALLPQGMASLSHLMFVPPVMVAWVDVTECTPAMHTALWQGMALQ